MKNIDVEKVTEIFENIAKTMELSTEQLETMNKAILNIEFALNRIADVLGEGKEKCESS